MSKFTKIKRDRSELLELQILRSLKAQFDQQTALSDLLIEERLVEKATRDLAKSELDWNSFWTTPLADPASLRHLQQRIRDDEKKLSGRKLKAQSAKISSDTAHWHYYRECEVKNALNHHVRRDARKSQTIKDDVISESFSLYKAVTK